MSKVLIGKHATWGIERTGETKEQIAIAIGAEISDIVFTEMEKTDYLLRDVPPEFSSKLSYMAYERGHSAGQDEVELILQELIYDLLPCIKDFEKRLTGK